MQNLADSIAKENGKSPKLIHQECIRVLCLYSVRA